MYLPPWYLLSNAISNEDNDDSGDNMEDNDNDSGNDNCDGDDNYW